MIFIGGGIGSLMRYGISETVRSLGWIDFSIGTLIANLIASFLLGLLSSWSIEILTTNPTYKIGLMVGLCGGLSTFSTFTAENYQLFEEGNMWGLLAYVTCSLVLCLVAFVLGAKLA